MFTPLHQVTNANPSKYTPVYGILPLLTTGGTLLAFDSFGSKTHKCRYWTHDTQMYSLDGTSKFPINPRPAGGVFEHPP